MTKEEIVSEILQIRTKLSGIIWAVVRDHHAAEDIFQEVVMKALGRREQFKDAEYLMAWAWVSSRNTAIDYIRKRKNRQKLLDKAALDALVLDLETEASESRVARMNALTLCLEQLPPNTQSIMHERYCDGKNVEAIAEGVGKSMDAVYQTISRTHRKLRECVEHQTKEPS